MGNSLNKKENKKENKKDPDLTSVQLAQEGNVIGLRALYDKYFEPIYRFCYWQTNSVEDAEDLTQETFVAMTSSLPKFRGDAQFRNWLYQIAKNLIAHWIKEKKKFAHLNLVEQLADDPHWVDPENEAYKQKLVTQLLLVLKPEEKKVITYRYLRGYSVSETAQKLKLTASNVKVLTYRSLRKIAKKFPSLPPL